MFSRPSVVSELLPPVAYTTDTNDGLLRTIELLMPPDQPTIIAESVLGILAHRSYLADIFEVCDGTTVRVREESRILSGHFAQMPIVPGVILADLARMGDDTGTWHISNPSKLMVLPGDTLQITPDPEDPSVIRIVRPLDGQIVMEVRREASISTVSWKEIDVSQGPVSDVNMDPSRTILHQPPFLFAQMGVITWLPTDTTRRDLTGATGEAIIMIPSDASLGYREGKNNPIPSSLLLEAAAQGASHLYGILKENFVRSEMSLEQKLSGDMPYAAPLNPTANIITLASARWSTGPYISLYGHELVMQGEVIRHESRQIEFIFRIMDASTGTIALTGSISGMIMQYRVIKKVHERSMETTQSKE